MLGRSQGGVSLFLGQSLPRLKEQFGLPCAQPLATQVALESQLGQLAHLRFDPRVLKRQLEAEMGAYVVSQLLARVENARLLHGEFATRLGIVRLRHCFGTVCVVNTTSWTAVKRAVFDRTTITKAQALSYQIPCKVVRSCSPRVGSFGSSE
eukprot:2039544-Amphidinium_carterae.1